MAGVTVVVPNRALNSSSWVLFVIIMLLMCYYSVRCDLTGVDPVQT